MAEPIQYQPKPAKTSLDAHEELEKLLQTAHEHGVLRFANDLIGANKEVAAVLVSGLSTEGASNAIQNLSALAMVLGHIPPNEFYKALFAGKDALERIGRYQPASEKPPPPGIRGAYKLLHDKELWSALNPVIEALKVFSKGLNRDVDKPISDYTGKTTRD